MTVYTPAQLINLALDEANKRVQSKDPGAGQVVIVGARDASKSTTITQAEFEQRLLMAARIMYAESGGDTAAVCYNVDDAQGNATCRKTPPAGVRGTDRGLWQFNSKAFPDVTDVCAYEAQCSTAAAYFHSNGFTAFGPWSKSAGVDPSARRYDEVRATINAAWESMQGTVRDDTPILSQIDPDANGAPNVGLGKLLGWTEALGKLLSRLIDPAFWRRFGMGALGILLVLIAVALVIADAKV
jgi:hypothetical protein